MDWKRKPSTEIVTGILYLLRGSCNKDSVKLENFWRTESQVKVEDIIET